MPALNLVVLFRVRFRVRVHFLVSFKFCLSGVIRRAKISLAHFSGRTRSIFSVLHLLSDPSYSHKLITHHNLYFTTQLRTPPPSPCAATVGRGSTALGMGLRSYVAWPRPLSMHLEEQRVAVYALRVG